MAVPAAAAGAATNSAAGVAAASGGMSAGGQAALTAGVQSGGGIFSAMIAAGANKRSQERTMAYNTLEAQKTRDYNERMANTAYQRSVADMRAAGLNPLMLYGGAGSGAGGASGAQGSTTPQHYDVSEAAEGIHQGVHSAIELRRLEQQDKAIEADIANRAGQAGLTAAEIQRVKAETAKTRVDTMLSKSTALATDSSRQESLARLNKMALELSVLEKKNWIQKKLGGYNELLKTVTATAQALGAIKDLSRKGGSTSYYILPSH